MPDHADGEAPGRVNLIGEHTDYHQGFVLPTVIPQRTRVRVERRSDRRVRASSRTIPGPVEEYVLGQEASGRDWLDYVQGATATLARDGVDLPGFDLRIESTIPVGAGVSSSAALEVSLLRALRTLLDLRLDDITLARIAQRVETDFVGAPVGIMDQIACSLGRDGEALFLDTRTLHVERVPIPEAVVVGVIDSGVTHTHAGGAYGTRRRESFEAAARLGVDWLRDLDERALPRVDSLPDPLAQRARHIITENARVLASVEALKAGDAVRLGTLFAASHRSMRDDYETSTPEIDILVEIASQHPEVFGARLTGGGFGGAVVLLVARDAAISTTNSVCAEYSRRTGRSGAVLVPAVC